MVIAIDARRTEVVTRSTRTAVAAPPAERQWSGRAEAAERGAGEILLTSMDQDGTKNGYDLDLTAAVARGCRRPVIASGGAGNPEHLRSVLTDAGAAAALAASIFHFDAHPVPETKRYLHDHGVEVRL